MPEGPEIRRVADRLRQAVVGKVAVRVRFTQDALSSFGGILTGRSVTAVQSKGKALLTHFEGGLVVYSHNQLFGRWYIVKAGQAPATQRQLRFSIETKQTWALLYSASNIEVLDAYEIEHHPFIKGLGPDVLDPSTNIAMVNARICESGRQLSALLLDQSFVAGLGNYLRSEILFVAGLRPEQRAKELSVARQKRLAQAILDVTRRSYHTGGITIAQELDVSLKSLGLSKRNRRHYVFARAGQPCRVCGSKIQKLEASGRRMYLCSTCQPA